MKYEFLFHRTPLYIAVEYGNIEIIKLLLSCQTLNVNLKSITKLNSLIKSNIT